MPEELATTNDLPDFAIPADLTLQSVSTEDILAVSTASDFLPRVQIMGSNSTLVQEGKVKQGTHAIVWTADRYQELGAEISFLSLSFRTKALRIPKDGNPISYFDRQSDNFKKVMVDSAVSDSGCMFGPEFLIWLPVPGCFATYFFGSKTGRRSAPALLTIMTIGEENGHPKFGPKPALSRVQLIRSKTYAWHGSVILPHSTPLPPPGEEFDLNVREVVTKFLNPPESEVEVAEPAAGSSRTR